MKRVDRSGVLVAVLVLLLVIGGATMALLQNGRDAHRQAADELAGLAAQLAAESALEEVAHRVAAGVNDAGSAVFPLFRAALARGEPVQIPCRALGPLTATARLLGDAPYGGRVALDPIRVWVDRHHAIQADRESERTGTVCSEVLATSVASGRPVVRRVRVEQGFRVSLATLPRPFDQLAFFVGGAAPFVEPVDALLARTAQALLGRDPAFGRTWTERNRAMLARLEDGLVQVERLTPMELALAGVNRREATGVLRAAIASRRTVMASLAPLVERAGRMDDGGRPHRLTTPDGRPTRLVLVRARGTELLALGSDGRPGLDAAGWARPLASRLDDSIERLRAAELRLDRAVWGAPRLAAVREASRACSQRWAETLALVSDALDRAGGFEDLLEEYPADTPEDATVERLFAEKFATAGLERRVMWWVQPEPGEAPADALERIWRGVDPARTTLDGVVGVRCPPGVPLRLSDRSPALARWSRGRAVLVVDGDCEVADLAPRPEATLSVIVRGALSVRGRVTAGLVALGPSSIAATVRGALVLARAPSRLEGLLEPDPRLGAGAAEQPDGEALVVALSPTRTRVAVDRTR